MLIEGCFYKDFLVREGFKTNAFIKISSCKRDLRRMLSEGFPRTGSREGEPDFRSAVEADHIKNKRNEFEAVSHAPHNEKPNAKLAHPVSRTPYLS
jgi:hypothetical protein